MTTQVQTDVHPGPRQNRSRARRAALVSYGAELLNTRDLDEVSIVEITDGLGFSTGSFYSYFADKSAFFVAVQEWVNHQQDEQIKEVFESAGLKNAELAQRLRVTVDFVLDYFRTQSGVVRSALRYERRIPQGWAPNRATTQRIVAGACRNLSPNDRARLEVALQLAFGMLVNAVLHDPGPLRLSDPEMGPKITEALTPYLTTQ